MKLRVSWHGVPSAEHAAKLVLFLSKLGTVIDAGFRTSLKPFATITIADMHPWPNMARAPDKFKVALTTYFYRCYPGDPGEDCWMAVWTADPSDPSYERLALRIPDPLPFEWKEDNDGGDRTTRAGGAPAPTADVGDPVPGETVAVASRDAAIDAAQNR